MNRSPEERRVAEIMAERTGTCADDWYLVYRARHGMLVTLEAVREELGEGHVVTQLLTCCTAVDPILAAGLEPVYAEISRCAASICPEKLEMPARTRAVMLQHTYGIVDERDSALLAEKAHAAGALVIEDCAHGLGRMARTADGRAVADISVHSFGVEKMLHTQFGGAIWVNPDASFASVRSRIRQSMEALPVAGSHLTSLTRTFVFWNRVYNHLPHGMARALRQTLTAVGLFEPAVSDEERRGAVSHEPLRPSSEICQRVIDAFAALDGDMRTRAEATATYAAELADVPGVELFSSGCTDPAQPLLKFPILVGDRQTADRITEEVCAAGYYTSTWYRPYLGPGVLDEAAYRVPADTRSIPSCMRIIDTVATLPTDQGEAGARAVAAIVRRVVSS